ncbi:MAG: hypothetical protein ACC612_11295 [Methanomethylovorans sp.]|uniref:hypothetical protein n=1 Tax=Methanomethylovorans sp. TaxID=2758717 RepID=UPI003530F7BD
MKQHSNSEGSVSTESVCIDVGKKIFITWIACELLCCVIAGGILIGKFKGWI